jgi:hypothetical protein
MVKLYVLMHYYNKAHRRTGGKDLCILSLNTIWRSVSRYACGGEERKPCPSKESILYHTSTRH